MRRVALAAALALTLSSCGDEVAQEWESYEQVPDCGTTEVDQDAKMQPSAEAAGCMEEAAAAGEQARLTVTHLTTDGHRVHSHFLLRESGQVSLFEDQTEDPEGQDEWFTTECVAPEWLPGATCP